MNDIQRKKIIKAELLETFAEIIDTLYGSTMGASGQNHAPGQVPDPGPIAGTNKFLREDGTWQIPAEPEIVKGYLSSGSFYTETQVAADYVEIGGLKWATKNIGATAVTDTGLYFQWGDTQGYTAAQVGSDTGQKYFGWADYKYGNGTSDPDATGMTKYNSSDGKTVLEASDDAVTAAWGGSWRMPTTAEYAALGNAVNTALTADYEGSGVSGLVCTDKTDSSKKLFFPDAGYCYDGSVYYVGRSGRYWSSSLRSSYVQYACSLLFNSSIVNWQYYGNRYYGFAVRGVWDGEGTPTIPGYVQVTPEQNKLYIDTTTNKIYRYDGSSYVEVSSAPTSLPASDVYNWAKAASKPSYTLDEVSDGSTRKLSDYPKKTIEVTWANLKSARDNSQLVPGQWYRITDYVTTTVQSNTQSAGHQFDIIVRADSTNKLNENAYAALHSGDTYFSNAGAKLEAWELKYCLDNDTSIFAWADTTNGKGVIYRMIDEFNNDCPYDFKNIQFKRYKITACAKGDLEGLYARSDAYGITADTATTYWSYTFCMYDLNESAPCDVSTYQDKYYGDEGYCYKNHNNSIKPYFTANYDTDPATYQMMLNDTVFITDTDICSIEEGNGEFHGFSNNIFEGDCYNNTFGNYCYYNTFGNGNYYNTFGNSCQYNTFGNDNYNNTFGNDNYYNTFGNSNYNNTFGNSCQYNTFGNICYSNTFGNRCRRNTFGNYFQYNSFGHKCYSNTFGNECYSNTFGNICYSNTFGNSCHYITFSKDYCYYNIVENGNQYITLTSTQTTSGSNLLCNITIAQGVNNTSTAKTISHNTVNDTFQTEYKPANSQVVSV